MHRNKNEDDDMKKTIVILALLFIGTLGAMTVEVGSIRGFMYGTEPACSYDNWVSHVVEAAPTSYTNHYAPWDVQTTGFGSYREPNEADRLQWNELIQAWLTLDFARADSLITLYNLPYELVHFQDLVIGREYYLLRELLNDDVDPNNGAPSPTAEVGSFDYGWGLYIYNPNASRPIIITAVHPCDGYPSPILALEALLKWDARFLFVAGAGREVLMTGHNNNTSLSDPSRSNIHVFNIAYQRACQQIRDLTGKTEFSVQMDTFDWQWHPDFSPVMVSAGNCRAHPSLPIVDESHLKKDLFHHTPWEVLPANAVGQHHPVTIEQYYSVYSVESIDCEASGQPAQIPASMELPGYLYNQQMRFTQQPNIYDSYSPFLHISMAELPNFLPQNASNWHKFYGWDNDLGEWNVDQRWTRFIQCYTPWLDALNDVLDDLTLMDDYQAPSNPENFRISSLTPHNFTLEWDRSYDYDFESYEIRITYQNEGEEVETIVDRDVTPSLARQSRSSVRMHFRDYSSPMTLRVKARDKNGRCSLESEDIFIFRPNPDLGSFTVVTIEPQTGCIEINFGANFQDQAHYRLTRSVNGGAYEELASLPVTPSGNYQYTDTDVSHSCFYRYRISVILADNTQLWYHQTLAAQPLRPITIYLQKQGTDLVDQLVIGHNYFARDGLDHLDIEKAEPTLDQPLVWLASKTDTPNLYLSRDLRTTYDELHQCKIWSLNAWVSPTNSDLIISSDIAQNGMEGYLLLWDETANRWHDLRNADYHWNNGVALNANFKLYWGFSEPEILFDDLPRQVLEAGSEIELNWQVINPVHMQHLELWMYSRCDSLLVNPTVSPWEGCSYTWQSPATAFYGYRLLAKVLDIAGNELRFLSPYVYDIVPQTVQVDLPPGFSMLSIPVQGWSCSVSSDFAPGTQAWKMSAGQYWVQTDELRALEAYIISTPVTSSLNYPGETFIPSFNKYLAQGWNLIPNAHFHRYDLSQLRFIMGEDRYSYAELSEMQLVSHQPYCLTSRGWELVDELMPNSSLLFQYFGTSDCSLLLDPQLLPSEQVASPKPWELTLSFYSGERGRDSILIGSYELGADTAISPIDGLKPGGIANQELQVHLWGPEGERLQSKYKSPYEENIQSSKIWDFSLSKTLSQTLTVEADCSKLPTDYRVQLIILGQSYDLTADQSLQIDLPDGIYTGNIVVTRGFTHNLDECYLGLRVYPNPFHDRITINWDDAKGASRPKAQVFNIKGQKVSDLNIHEASGKFTATWDGRDQNNRNTAKGIYLIRIEHSGRKFAKKVIKY